MTPRALFLAALACHAPLAAQGANRLWIGRVELVGPLERVELLCDAEGTTRIDAALVAGERREIDVPVAWAPPLGLAGLAAHAPPRVRVAPLRTGAAAGTARWLGLAPEQPEARWTRLPVSLRSRPRPPVDAARSTASLAGLLLVAAAQIAVLGAATRRGRSGLPARTLPRATRALLAVAVAACAGAFGARGGAAGGAPIVLVDADLGPKPVAVRAAAAWRELALGAADPGLRVETAPEGAALDYAVDLAAGTWRARAAGVVVAYRTAEPPGDAAALAPAWWRSAAGEWQRYAAVGAGAARAEPGPDPPGWLRAGLPPGRAVLIGRPAPADATADTTADTTAGMTTGATAGSTAGSTAGATWFRAVGAAEPR